jgi:ABC-2 type transport system ATP-binding protein
MGAAGVLMEDLGMARPSLDDVFLTLTGHSADPVAEPDSTAELV